MSGIAKLKKSFSGASLRLRRTAMNLMLPDDPAGIIVRGISSRRNPLPMNITLSGSRKLDGCPVVSYIGLTKFDHLRLITSLRFVRLILYRVG